MFANKDFCISIKEALALLRRFPLLFLLVLYAASLHGPQYFTFPVIVVSQDLQFLYFLSLPMVQPFGRGSPRLSFLDTVPSLIQRDPNCAFFSPTESSRIRSACFLLSHPYSFRLLLLFVNFEEVDIFCTAKIRFFSSGNILTRSTCAKKCSSGVNATRLSGSSEPPIHLGFI